MYRISKLLYLHENLSGIPGSVTRELQLLFGRVGVRRRRSLCRVLRAGHLQRLSLMSVLAGLRSCRQLRQNAFSAAAQRLTARNASTFASERPTVPPPTRAFNASRTWFPPTDRLLHSGHELSANVFEVHWPVAGYQAGDRGVGEVLGDVGEGLESGRVACEGQTVRYIRGSEDLS